MQPMDWPRLSSCLMRVCLWLVSPTRQVSYKLGTLKASITCSVRIMAMKPLLEGTTFMDVLIFYTLYCANES